MSNFFEKIKEGLEDAISHQKGKITLRTEIIEIPEPPAEYSAKLRRASAPRNPIHKTDNSQG